MRKTKDNILTWYHESRASSSSILPLRPTFSDILFIFFSTPSSSFIRYDTCQGLLPSCPCRVEYSESYFHHSGDGDGSLCDMGRAFQDSCSSPSCDQPILPAESPVPPLPSTDKEKALWRTLDATVLQWIYAMISTDLLHTILEPDSTVAEAWTRLVPGQ